MARNGMDLPEKPPPANFCPIRPALPAAAGLNLVRRIGTIIWATGYTTDYRWLKVNAFDDTAASITAAYRRAGRLFLGLPWLSRRGSTFIWGVWHDAKYIADQIAIQRQYRVTSRPVNRFHKECFDANSYPYSHV